MFDLPYIKVDINKLSQYLQTVENVNAITGSAAENFYAISSSVDVNLRQKNNIDGQLRRIEEELHHHQRVMSNMTAFLDHAQQKYRLLSHYDEVGNADLMTGAVYAAANVAVVSAMPSGGERKVVTGADYRPGSHTAVGATGTSAATAAKPDANAAVAKNTNTEAEGKNQLAAVVASTVGAAVTLGEMDQAQILRYAATSLNVETEELLKGVESGAYTLKDIAECLEGKATEANNFIQNAANTLKGLTGTENLRFEQKDGYWILSGYERDSKANDLVKKYHDGTGIGSRYKEETLENTPVLGIVFKTDQLAEKAEKVAEVAQKTADTIDKGADIVLGVAEATGKIKEHGTEAAVKIAEVMEDDSLSKDEKIATTKAIVDTTIVSTALDVGAPYAGKAVGSVVEKLIGDKSGDATLGKEAGKIAEKVVSGGMTLVSNVVSSEEVVEQVAESNLEISNTIQSGGKSISEAGKKIAESDSIGETILNVGSFVTTVGKTGTEIVSTVAKETAKVVYTVGKETVEETAKMVGDAVIAGCETVAQNVKEEYETLKGFKEDVVGGMSTVAVLAGETYSIIKSSKDDVTLAEAIALAAKEMGISKEDVHESIDKGLCTVDDIFEYLDGKATASNNFVKQGASILRTVSGATDMMFKSKDGYIIVSDFTRNGWTNTLVKTFNDGTGIGTRYKPETLKDTPVIGTIFKADQAVKTMDKIASGVNAVVTGVSGLVETGKKINDIWADETLTQKEKIYDTAAIAVTGVVATALDVAAPFAGAAVKTAVAGAISAVLPGVGPVIGNAVGAVAGALVENGMKLVSDVITSEAVVNQVSDSMTAVGDAVEAEVKAVSDAGKKLMESKNAAEAVKNTAAFVGTAVTSGAKVVATAVTESAKVAATVVKETAKAVGEAVVAKAKAVGEAAKKVAENTKEAAKKVGDAVVAGAKVVSQAAKEAADKAAKALEKAKEEAAKKAAEAKKKAEEAARKAAEAAKKAAEEVARKAAEAKKKAEEAAKKAAEAAKKKAAEAKKKAEEAAKKAAEAAKKKAAEAKKKAEEAAKKAAAAAKKKAEEAKKKAEEAAKKAKAAAKKVTKALSKW